MIGPTTIAALLGLITFQVYIVYAQTNETEHPAAWMSGKWGLGMRIGAGDYIERRESVGWGFDPNGMAQQVASSGASWFIINLSEGAFGSTWMSYHPVLSEINPKGFTGCYPGVGGGGWSSVCQTAPTPSKGNDYFKRIADAMHAQGVKVIAYVAGQGPAMFGGGTKKAYDWKNKNPKPTGCTHFAPYQGPKECFADPDNCCAKSVGNWIKYVRDLPQNNGTIDYPKLHTAFADVIVAYYAELYKDDIDGWWIDNAHENGQQANCGEGSTCSTDYVDRAAIHAAIRRFQPNVPISFNGGCAQRFPLKVCDGDVGTDDYTSGHPSPLGGGTPTMVFDDVNYAMVTSTENSDNGYYTHSSGWKMLSHVFMPTGTNWNGPTIANVWTTPYPYTTEYNWKNFDWGNTVTQQNGWNVNATDWFSRTLKAGGAWTWNLPRESNEPNTYWLFHRNHMAMVNHVASEYNKNKGPTAAPTTASPEATPTMLPSSTPSEVCTDSTSPFPNKNKKGNIVYRDCEWVREKPEKLDRRCRKEKTASHCPNTCGQCQSYGCSNSLHIFQITKKDGTTKDIPCSWLDKKPSKLEKRCQKPIFATTCRDTCELQNDVVDCLL